MARRIGQRAFVCSLVGLALSLGDFCLPGESDAQQPEAPRRIGVLLGGVSPPRARRHRRSGRGY